MGRLTVFVLVLGLPAWAQPGPTAQKFLANVKGWTGSLDIHGTGSGTIAGPAGGTAQYKTDMHTSGILTLDSFNALTNSWVGTLNGTIVISEQSIVSFVCTTTSTFTANTSAQSDGLGKPLTWKGGTGVAIVQNFVQAARPPTGSLPEARRPAPDSWIRALFPFRARAAARVPAVLRSGLSISKRPCRRPRRSATGFPSTPSSAARA